MLLTILLILLVCGVFFGGWGHGRVGFASWSPAGIILLVLVVLWFFGKLHL